MHDKLVEIIVHYIESLERIEAELMDECTAYAERSMRAETDNRYLRMVLAQIADGHEDAKKLALDAISVAR